MTIHWTLCQPFEGCALGIAERQGKLVSLCFARGEAEILLPLRRRFPRDDTAAGPDHPLLQETEAQLSAYFDGRLRAFDLPLDTGGTVFQRSVWSELQRIPYGQTRSYRDVASAIGKANAVRAVGAANSANPIAIVIPCHRVIAANGTLWGYGGGLDLKRRLLDLERAHA
jgi:methylated-DNA-[protein]-cysteine S-methyltransferase